jgi:DNA primase
MNVEELLTSKNVWFRPNGNDFLVHCLNPEHEDNNPSMRIDRILGIFNCFSCGYKGNIFSYFEEEKDRLGMQREKLKRKILTTKAASTGLSMPEGHTRYVGNWRNISAKTYAHFGAFKHHHPDFIGRLVFPIRNASGKIIAFIGRDETGTLPQKYKIHPVGAKLQPFPAKPTLLNGRVLLVEGIFDVLNLFDKGIQNCCAIFGINNFTEEHLNNFRIQGCSGVDIMLDADDAGAKGTEQIKKVCDEVGVPFRVVKLRRASDPGSLTSEEIQRIKKRLYNV